MSRLIPLTYFHVAPFSLPEESCRHTHTITLTYRLSSLWKCKFIYLRPDRHTYFYRNWANRINLKWQLLDKSPVITHGDGLPLRSTICISACDSQQKKNAPGRDPDRNLEVGAVPVNNPCTAVVLAKCVRHSHPLFPRWEGGRIRITYNQFDVVVQRVCFSWYWHTQLSMGFI